MAYVKILGTGAYVPERVLKNSELQKMVDTSDEWITTRTGIKERRISTFEDASDLGANAARIALENSGVSKDDIDYIIVATISSETLTPSTACVIQSKLEASNATAYDLNGACSGFMFALIQGEALIKAGKAKKVLVIGSEVLSKITNWKDRGTCVLFGDGAGAAVLGEGDKGILSTYSKSFGNLGMYLTAGGRSLGSPFIEDKLDSVDGFINMNGKEVFKFASYAMTNAVKKLCEDENIHLEDIDVIIPHQANYRIIEYASTKLNIPIEKFFIHLEKYGNTSAASVPMAMHEAIEKKIIKEDMNVVLVAFGGGLTVGAALIKF
ncbi:beta-ketoacyl-ACP synthase III [Clostridium frigidicarnis]|uniref:Beta-ketoacyl-[acyl-carrier-protein] synthase III n=1 Tax=Clostridium frigidicarnis TaxID=84698 RepID=A0A1I0VLT5_9CLOT|nr:beta-ketoacyl-ACP synthase III [Clostridium frigidicarnis]SFA77178.1 3-oxoacyl-[acyl-carrier-protein] synthase III [Clostridium frigidicarnis]